MNTHTEILIYFKIVHTFYKQPRKVKKTNKQTKKQMQTKKKVKEKHEHIFTGSLNIHLDPIYRNSYLF